MNGIENTIGTFLLLAIIMLAAITKNKSEKQQKPNRYGSKSLRSGRIYDTFS